MATERACGEFGKRFTLLQDSQDLQAMFAAIDQPDLLEWVASAFVVTFEGQYKEVWVSGQFVPWLWVKYERVV